MLVSLDQATRPRGGQGPTLENRCIVIHTGFLVAVQRYTRSSPISGQGDVGVIVNLDRQRRAEDIFAQALEVPTDSRSKYLVEACAGDLRLREEVDTLLRDSPDARGWFDALMKEELTRALTLSEVPRAAAIPEPAEPPGEIAAGSTLAHYQIEKRLGAGGMGDVFEAWDLALARPAAIKVLRSGLSADLRRRLVREGGIVARLGHPVIAASFESGESQGVQYLAMEYVEGETLRSRLRRGPLPPSESIGLVAALLEALVHAHAIGILHRDIKPENIMLTSKGGVKLLDFGIAKAIDPRDERAAEAPTEDLHASKTTTMSMTEHGAILGTLGYMAPEQLRSEAVGPAADLFALGAVFYEMLTGERAFPGRTDAEKMASILSREVPLVSSENVPPECNAILKRALARDPSQRYSTAAEFLSDLRTVMSGDEVAPLSNTLAVIDFRNLSGGAEDDWLGSGLAESLRADIGRVEGLTLVPRSKVLQAQAELAREHSETGAVQLGRILGCRLVLSGEFRRTGSSLRLETRLIEVSTSLELWAETLDGDLKDLFAMRDRLARLTAESLHLVVSPRKAARAGERIDAFEFYARGKKLWDKGGRGTFERAQESFRRAIELDPNHAPALAWLASTFAPGRWIATTDPNDLKVAAELATRAVEIDPDLADARVWLAYALWRQGRRREALESLTNALELEPSNPMALYFSAAVLLDLGRTREALSYAQRCAAVDSSLTANMMALGFAHMELEQFDEARWSLEKAWSMEHTAGTVGWSLSGSMLAECMRRQRALAAARVQCLSALVFTEQSDNIHRDVARGLGLDVLGRIALDEGNLVAAQVAYRQAVLHARGRPHGMGMGHVLVQALAGQSRAGMGTDPYEEGRRIFEERKLYDFSFGALTSDRATLVELARAAHGLGLFLEANSFLQRARDADSGEARRMEIGETR